MKFINVSEIESTIRDNSLILLGQIQVSEDMYRELLENANWKINHLFVQSLPRPDIILSLTMVQVAIRHFRNGKYWKVFNEQIGTDISVAKQNYIGRIFLKTIREYRLFELSREDGNTAMYVENVKAHAFVTDSYMHGFLDFSYAYYENNLFRQLQDDISEDLEDLSSFMAETLKNNNDAIISGESGVRAAKTYKLLKSTRAIFAQCTSENLQKMFYPILEMIDRYFYEGEIPEIVTNRYEKAFVNWLKKRENEKNEVRGNVIIERTTISHKPYIHVDDGSEKAFLIIPAQKFRSDDCDGNAVVEITINGCMETRRLELYTSFGIFISDQIMIQIPDIFTRIDICIKSIVKKNYKISESSYRIFDRKWNNIGKFTKGHNYLLTKKTANVNWDNENDIIDLYDGCKFWDYYSVIIGEESVCYVDKHPLSILGEFSVEPIFDSVIEKYTITRGDKKVLASPFHPTISFVVPEVKMGGTSLKVNGRLYMLLDIHEKTYCVWPEDKTKVAVTMALEDVLGHAQGFFTIELDIPGEQNKLLCEYLALKKFSCKFNKARFMYDEYADFTIVHYNTVLMNIPKNWIQLDAVENFSTTYTIPLSSEMEEIKFDFYMDEVFTLSMPLKVFMYGFSLPEMRIDKPEYLWYGDLNEILYIKIPGAVSAGAYLRRKEEHILDGEELEPGLFRINISEFIRNIRDEYKKKDQEIVICYVDNKKRKVPLPRILRNLLVEPFFELEYSEKEGVYTTVNLKGKAIPYLTVKDYQTDNILINHRECYEGKNLFPELTKEGYYDLYPSMEESDEFCFDVIETPLKIKKGVGAIDINNITNCMLIVKMLVCDEEVLPLEYEYRIYLTEKEAENTYLGHMNSGKKDTLKKFGRIRIELYQIEEEIKATMQLFSYNEEIWMDPYYDVERDMIISCNDPLLDTIQDVSRFILLDSEITEFIFDRKRLRRTR
ncbi:MAG: hypothetical protein K2G45_01380 [Lachnospiraceae bacterium]|nr:hypothetical protein [Lachnospiraceae bacterium]